MDVPPPSRRVTLAVAPPTSSDRARFVVEKAAELGVAGLLWLQTRFGQGRVPNPSKSASWARSALEQSQGAWTMEIGGPSAWSDLAQPLLIADRLGAPWSDVAASTPDVVTLVVGPEGGFAPGEVPPDSTAISVSQNTLRIETAAAVAAALLLLPTDVGAAQSRRRGA